MGIRVKVAQNGSSTTVHMLQLFFLNRQKNSEKLQLLGKLNFGKLAENKTKVA